MGKGVQSRGVQSKGVQSKLARPKSRQLASLFSKWSASPSIYDSAEKTSAFWSDVASCGKRHTGMPIVFQWRNLHKAIGRLVCTFLLMSLRFEASGAAS